MSYSGPSLLLLLLPSIHEKTIYGVNVMGAIRKLFSYWFSLKWEENGAAFFFGGNFALFSCGNSTVWTAKNGMIEMRFCDQVTNLCEITTFDLPYGLNIKSLLEISKNCDAFSE